MNAQETGRVNDVTKVETVDYRSPAGQDEPKKENVGVVHLKRNEKDNPGILARTAAAVTNSIKSAKDAITGKSKDNTTN